MTRSAYQVHASGPAERNAVCCRLIWVVNDRLLAKIGRPGPTLEFAEKIVRCILHGSYKRTLNPHRPIKEKIHRAHHEIINV